jgi:hypothetical protein
MSIGMRLDAGDPLQQELRRPLPFIRIDAAGNARMNWAGYLLCASTAALVVGAGWKAICLLYG